MYVDMNIEITRYQQRLRRHDDRLEVSYEFIKENTSGDWMGLRIWYTIDDSNSQAI